MIPHIRKEIQTWRRGEYNRSEKELAPSPCTNEFDIQTSDGWGEYWSFGGISAWHERASKPTSAFI